jgi:hypothetical protein
MYHCQVVALLLTLATATKELRPRLSEFCRDKASRMLAFIQSIVHTDGEIPLLGDSVFDESPGMIQLNELAKVAGVDVADSVHSKTKDHYWTHRQKAISVVFDAGQVGAQDLPAHAHCDLLGLEASIDGQRWFVDSGNFNYSADAMRRYCRSAVAHNVVTVDGYEMCDVWSIFRMGARGKPIRLESGSDGLMHWVRASHNAYRGRAVGHLQRTVVVRDEVIACADLALTTARPLLEGYLHLAPDIAVDRLGERRFRLVLGETIRQIEFFGVGDVSLAEGWYCPRFGERIRNTCFVYRQDIGPVVYLGWVLSPTDCTLAIDAQPDRWRVECQHPSWEWSFS